MLGWFCPLIILPLFLATPELKPPHTEESPCSANVSVRTCRRTFLSFPPCATRASAPGTGSRCPRFTATTWRRTPERPWGRCSRRTWTRTWPSSRPSAAQPARWACTRHLNRYELRAIPANGRWVAAFERRSSRTFEREQRTLVFIYSRTTRFSLSCVQTATLIRPEKHVCFDLLVSMTGRNWPVRK